MRRRVGFGGTWEKRVGKVRGWIVGIMEERVREGEGEGFGLGRRWECNAEC
jgi:hypothetical protein